MNYDREEYPIGDFNIQAIGLKSYCLTVFLNHDWLREISLDVFRYRFGLTKAYWDSKDEALEIELSYEEVKYVINLIKLGKGLEEEYINLMFDVLETEAKAQE